MIATAPSIKSFDSVVRDIVHLSDEQADEYQQKHGLVLIETLEPHTKRSPHLRYGIEQNEHTIESEWSKKNEILQSNLDAYSLSSMQNEILIESLNKEKNCLQKERKKFDEKNKKLMKEVSKANMELLCGKEEAPKSKKKEKNKGSCKLEEQFRKFQEKMEKDMVSVREENNELSKFQEKTERDMAKLQEENNELSKFQEKMEKDMASVREENNELRKFQEKTEKDMAKLQEENYNLREDVEVLKKWKGDMEFMMTLNYVHDLLTQIAKRFGKEKNEILSLAHCPDFLKESGLDAIKQSFVVKFFNNYGTLYIERCKIAHKKELIEKYLPKNFISILDLLREKYE